MPEEYEPGDDYSSLIFVRVLPNLTADKAIDKAKGHIPLGYVFVLDNKYKDAFWKLPGGHGKKDGNGKSCETPRATAQRELFGEAGIEAPEKDFEQIACIRRYRPVPHWLFFFAVNIREADSHWMGTPHDENEGERPKFFSVDEFRALVKERHFFPPHYSMLDEFSLVLFMGPDVQPA